MAKQTVLSLFESKGELKVDEARLSAPLLRKIAELDAIFLVLDHLKAELFALKKQGRQLRTLFLSSFVAAILGLFLGAAGLVGGALGALQVFVSLVAALGLFVVEFYVLRYQRVTQAAVVQRSRQIQSLSSDLEDRLDGVFDEVQVEMARAPPTFGRRSAAVRAHARRETG